MLLRLVSRTSDLHPSHHLSFQSHLQSHRIRSDLRSNRYKRYHSKIHPKMEATNTQIEIIDPSQITLTPKEQEVIQLLRNVVEQTNCGSTLRIAGGWVRDKLLGKDNDDIDIAIDNMVGKQFADLVQKYQIENGMKGETIGVIQSNPEQSKHLETATMKICGVWIDLVNLRTEDYTDTRRPTVSTGSPLEDCLRRDLTINSLFYNINTHQVEDLSGKGISDLRDGIIRTPLTPLTTFLDDPLRVLRAIRFAGRFGFSMDPELMEAAQHPQTKDALLKKVSRERFGAELKGMFRGKVFQSFSLIEKFGLAPIIFKLPPNAEPAVEDSSEQRMSTMKTAFELLDVQKLVEISPEVREFILFAAYLSPLGTTTFPNAKKRPESVVRFIILESVKLSLNDADNIFKLIQSAEQFSKAIPAALDTFSRREIGFLIREVGPLWKESVLLASAIHISKMKDSNLKVEDLHFDAERFIKKCLEENLDEIYSTKPLLNGNDLMSLFQAPAGHWLSHAMHEEMGWMLEHPDATVQECRDWMISQKEKLAPKQSENPAKKSRK
eukprot:TRINITY_DN8303_c0_g1_i1.p1 TRINITY_DN8303_c0_g1~~TRINITY_DN8303_c0_g1_i1.p1  ORF type:complete len:552 (+),score=178.47 TRINITY_DN8303_c0_g1_i1:11-1666(+)